MSTLGSFMDGITTAMLSYFFDDKEPVTVLKPMTEQHLDNKFALALITEALGNSVNTLQGNNHLMLISNRTAFCTIQTNASCVHLAATGKGMSDDAMHLANVSQLWHFTQSVRDRKDTAADNFRSYAKFLVTLVESNTGRLTSLTLSNSEADIQGVATWTTNVMGGIWTNIIHFSSDSRNWDLGDFSWGKKETPKNYYINTLYVKGELKNVIAFNDCTLKTPLFKADITVVQEQFYGTELSAKNVTFTAIPDPLKRVLDIDTYYAITQTVDPVTGMHVVEHRVRTRSGKYLDVVVTH